LDAKSNDAKCDDFEAAKTKFQILYRFERFWCHFHKMKKYFSSTDKGPARAAAGVGEQL
jgi:hypothetical protein